MKCYKYYAKVDSTKEPINILTVSNIEEATQTFAQLKNMEVNEFVKIFVVEKHDRP